MERRFRLQRFLPPGLIPRIIACSYQYTKERPTASRYAGALNQCWKSAFSQRHGAVLIWLWLEDNTALHEDFEKVDRASIRVVGFGNYFGAKVIVEWLEKYCTAVTHVLKEFPGLCHLSQTIVCPTCLMSQFEEDECGEFSYTDLHCQLDENHGDQCPVPNSSSAIGTEMDEIRFEHKQAMCDKRQCMIPFELLVTKPHNAIVAPVSENTMQRQMERRIEYLTNEIIRLSSVPSSSCEKAVASVAVAYIPTIEMAYIKTWVASGKENSSDISMCSTPVATAYLKTLATGAFTRIPCCGGKTTATVVLSCAHFCINDTTKLFPIADLPGYDTIFLIGGKLHLYSEYLLFIVVSCRYRQLAVSWRAYYSGYRFCGPQCD